MQAFSVNIDNNDPFCVDDKLIKSLSDDEDSEEKEYDGNNTLMRPPFSESDQQILSQIQDHEDKKHHDLEMEDVEEDDNLEDEEREMSILTVTTQCGCTDCENENDSFINDDDDAQDENVDDENVDDEYYNNNKKEEEEEEDIDYDKNLVLDKDIEIAKVLNKYLYKNVSKLCYTDQGSVWRAKSPKKFGYQSVVIKIASKLHYHQNGPSEHENILSEIELLQEINGKQKESDCNDIKNSVIQVIDIMESTNNYMVVLEDGGIDLFNFINKCHQEIANGKMTIKDWQKTTKLIAQKLIKLLNWLHNEVNVCHLDISLENVLISNIKWISYPDQYKNYKKKLSDDFKITLIDFGAAKKFINCDSDGNISFDSLSTIGKPQYCSPQIYKLQNKLTDKSFDARATDTWSFGVSLFIMAIGCPPWQMADERSNKLFQTIVIEQNIGFVLKAWNRFNYIDDSMRDLLQKIFILDEKDRITTNDIIKHPWFS